MPNLFKSLMSHRDDDEELDLEFDLATPESECYELPPDRQDNQVLAVWGRECGVGVFIIFIRRFALHRIVYAPC